MTRPVHGVILAAGTGVRFGSPKQLAEIAGKPMLQHVIDAACASRLATLTTVLGYDAETVSQGIQHRCGEIFVNSRYAEGQSSSVLAGIDSTPDGTNAVLFLLGDQPGIDVALIDALIDAWYESSPLGVVTELDGQPANPVLIDRRLFNEVRRIRGDRGARAVLRRHRDDVRVVQWHDPTAILDVDTPDDIQRLSDATD